MDGETSVEGIVRGKMSGGIIMSREKRRTPVSN